MNRLFSTLLGLTFFVSSACAAPMNWDSIRHEVRIGWGDPLFENATKYEFPHIGRPNIKSTYLTGHFFVEYQYAWKSWLSSGMQVDYMQVGWKDWREQDINYPAHYYYNLSLIPTVRFTYYRHPIVKLYAAVGLGITINGGTEQDPLTQKYTLPHANVNLTLFGMQVGKGHFFGTFELGVMNALRSFQQIVMIGSRALSVSAGYRF